MYNIVRFKEVTSTNDIAKEYAKKGCASGTVILAENQTCGRGRHGAKWESEPGVSILMSMVLYPKLKLDEMQKIVDMGVEAVIKVISDLGLDAYKKEPNDVFVNGKKIAGILVESSAKGDKVDYAVLGIGLNVNNRKFSNELKDIATSLCLETGKEYDREKIFLELLTQFKEKP